MAQKAPACDACEFDVAIIGGGPAGIAAAISIRSEGPSVVVIDSKAAGGQAATSSKIENVFGVPVGGISGGELMARGVDQAHAFGVKFRSPFNAVRLTKDSATGFFTITASNRATITAASVVLALGASFRRLDADGMEQYAGRGVAYGSPQYQVPAQWQGKKVGIIGGGNSAGQAALFLSQCEGCEVNVLVRGEDLESDMSHYLLNHVREQSNIIVHNRTTLKGVQGNETWMQCVRTLREGVEHSIPLDYLLVQIGAEPQTGWLDDTLIALDHRGYIFSDRDLPEGRWPESTKRPPFQFETSLPGVFVGGDSRSGSFNRMSCAVGDGHSLAVNVFRYLTSLRQGAKPRLVSSAA